MRLAITSDELSSDLHSVLELASEHNCREIEVRRLGLDLFPAIDERWLAALDKAIASKRVRVACVSPEIFGAPDADARARILAAAKRMHCGLVSLFAPLAPGGGRALNEEADEDADADEDGDPLAPELPPVIELDALREFAAEAAREGVALAIRTRQDSYAGTAEEALALLDALETPEIGLDWDVAECFAAGDGSGLDALEDTAPRLKLVHARDAVRKGLGADWVSVGKGVIPWQDILEQLYEAGYRGPVVADPRVAPKIRESRAALTLFARWIEAARFKARHGDREERESSGRRERRK